MYHTPEASSESKVENLSPPPAPPTAQEPARSRGKLMHPPLVKIVKIGLPILLVAAGLVLFFVVLLPSLNSSNGDRTIEADPPLPVDLVGGVPHTLRVPEDVRKALGIRKGKEDQFAVARVPREPEDSVPLVMSASTSLEPGGIARLRFRFPSAEVVDIPRVVAQGLPGESTRELGPGDTVKAGQPLVTLYSVDVGAKKNDLIDALVQFKLDREILDNYEKNSSVLPEVLVLSQRSKVESDRNAINRARDTLRVWDIPREDIEAIEQEAERLSKLGAKRDHKQDIDPRWAQVVLKAPRDGTIIERNISLKDIIVDNTLNLFQVAEVDRLLVIANAGQDDLRALLKLPQEKRRWAIRTLGASAEKGIEGRIEEIGYLIDVNQRSAVIKGRILNPGKELRAGEYVTATVNLPPPNDVVEIPVNAVVDDGKQVVVFVQPDQNKPEYTMRRVEVVKRFETKIWVKREMPLTAGEKDIGVLGGSTATTSLFLDGDRRDREQALLIRSPLLPGERVLTAGVLELKKELEDREASDGNSDTAGKE
jgi:cobalt-zinc-cadmium efflux system membrane fusion protein